MDKKKQPELQLNLLQSQQQLQRPHTIVQPQTMPMMPVNYPLRYNMQQVTPGHPTGGQVIRSGFPSAQVAQLGYQQLGMNYYYQMHQQLVNPLNPMLPIMGNLNQYVAVTQKNVAQYPLLASSPPLAFIRHQRNPSYEVFLKPCRLAHSRFTKEFPTSLSSKPYKYLILLRSELNESPKVYFSLSKSQQEDQIAHFKKMSFSQLTFKDTDEVFSVHNRFIRKKRYRNPESPQKLFYDYTYEIQFQESSSKTRCMYKFNVKSSKTHQLHFTSTPFLLYIRKSSQEIAFWRGRLDLPQKKETPAVPQNQRLPPKILNIRNSRIDLNINTLNPLRIQKQEEVKPKDVKAVRIEDVPPTSKKEPIEDNRINGEKEEKTSKKRKREEMNDEISFLPSPQKKRKLD